MKNKDNTRPDKIKLGEADNVFARTADIFQRLGPDCRKNIDTILSGALSVIGGRFSVYLETGGDNTLVRYGSNLPAGLAADLERDKTWITPLVENRDIIIWKAIGQNLTSGHGMPDAAAMTKYGIKAMIGTSVMANGLPFGILWVADTRSREFTSDHVHAIQCLAGTLGCQTELIQARKNRKVMEMAGMVAHDLNNILSGLVSYPELILMQLEGSSPLREPISFIHESGLMASDMIQDFLFLARPRSYHPSPIDPRPVANAYFSGSAHALLKKTCPLVRFSFHTDTPLCRIKISELFLTKIITILVAHSAHGAVPGTRIDLCLTDHRGPTSSSGLKLSVRDDAPPLSRENLNHLFDPFYTRKKMGRPGSGLGLTVVKKVVKDHGGKITAGGKEGKGNFIDIFFPS